VRQATAPSMPCFVRSVPTRSMRSAREGACIQTSNVPFMPASKECPVTCSTVSASSAARPPEAWT